MDSPPEPIVEVKHEAEIKPPNILPLIKPYVPQQLICREEQFTELEAEVMMFLNRGVCSNRIIDGVTGSGKTTTIMTLLHKYKDAIHYMDSSLVRGGELDFLNSISGSSVKNTTKALQETILFLNENRKILVLDEFDKVVNKIGANAWHDLNTIYRETAIPIIIITNQKDLLKTMPEDARLTLFLSFVYFNAYTVPQIYQILDQRIRIVGFKFKDEVRVLNWIAQDSYETGSARTAIDILRYVILSGNDNPTNEELTEYKNKLNMEELRFQISRMMPAERKTLYIISKIMSQPGTKYLTSGDVYRTYNNTYPPIHQVYFSQILTALRGYFPLDLQLVSGSPRVGKRNTSGQTRQVIMDMGFANQILSALRITDAHLFPL